MKVLILGTVMIVLSVADYLSRQSRGISSQDLNLGMDSAVALVGPEDSFAGANRLQLRERLRQHYARRMQASLRFKSERIARMMARTLPGRRAIARSNATVIFPDESVVQVRVIEDLHSVLGNGEFEMNPAITTVVTSDLLAVPQSRGQFSGFQYSGNEDIVSELIDLATRFGIPITRAGSDQGGAGAEELQCQAGDGEISCTDLYSPF